MYGHAAKTLLSPPQEQFSAGVIERIAFSAAIHNLLFILMRWFPSAGKLLMWHEGVADSCCSSTVWFVSQEAKISASLQLCSRSAHRPQLELHNLLSREAAVCSSSLKERLFKHGAVWTVELHACFFFSYAFFATDSRRNKVLAVERPQWASQCEWCGPPLGQFSAEAWTVFGVFIGLKVFTVLLCDGQNWFKVVIQKIFM